MPIAGYRIVDEPRPSGLSRLAVRPFWPLLGLMLGGAWLAWPWFAVNTLALGMATRGRVLAWIAVGIAGSVAIAAFTAMAGNAGLLSHATFPWVDLALLGWKLTVAYVICELQSPASELFVYFGGRVRNPALVLAAGYFGGRFALIAWYVRTAGTASAVLYMVLK